MSVFKCKLVGESRVFMCWLEKDPFMTFLRGYRFNNTLSSISSWYDTLHLNVNKHLVSIF